jgi:hypothetical protein
MATRMLDMTTGKLLPAHDLRLMFVCDRCGNTAPFKNGMETFRIAVEGDNRSFCSQICVEAQIQQEAK